MRLFQDIAHRSLSDKQMTLIMVTVVLVVGNAFYICAPFPLKRPKLLRSQIEEPCIFILLYFEQNWHTKNKELEGKKCQPQGDGAGGPPQSMFSVALEKNSPTPPYFAFTKADILQLDVLFFVMLF